MTRPIRHLALALALAGLGAALLAPAAAGARTPVLGAKDLFGRHGHGWGTVRPDVVSNGGAPSSRASDVTWRGWGRGMARGQGRVRTHRPGGGYYRKRVRIQFRATRLASCPGTRGRPAYTRLIARVKRRPGGRYGDWSPWTLDLCDLDATPRRCGRIAFTPNSDHGAFAITAWDASCRAARRVARASRNVAPRRGGTRYRFEARGFVCNGYAFDDGLASVDFTCWRGTAEVRFGRS